MIKLFKEVLRASSPLIVGPILHKGETVDLSAILYVITNIEIN